jgi:hypothetical protein
MGPQSTINLWMTIPWLAPIEDRAMRQAINDENKKKT